VHEVLKELEVRTRERDQAKEWHEDCLQVISRGDDVVSDLLNLKNAAEAKLEAVRVWSLKMRENDWQKGLLQMAFEQIADELDEILEGE
jgi:hypothetical protein